jgi:hypothetical protein
VLAALLPFGALENVGADFDQAREHFEDGDWSPRGALTGAESAAVDFVGDAGVGAFLDNEFHEQEKEFALDGIFLQALSVGCDLQAEGQFGGERSFGGFDFALPLEGDELPSLIGLLLEIGRLQGSGDNLADAFGPFHSGHLGWIRGEQVGCQRRIGEVL